MAQRLISRASECVAAICLVSLGAMGCEATDRPGREYGQTDAAGWTWKDQKGETRTRADLDRILESHREWASGGKNGARAQLQRADFTGADLCGVDLGHVDLTASEAAIFSRGVFGATAFSATPPSAETIDRALDLEGRAVASTLAQHQHPKVKYDPLMTLHAMRQSFLKDAGLHQADADALMGADLTGAVLRGAKLQNANLAGVQLNNSDLTEADLANCVLSNANLQGADLPSANLSSADLRLANLREADLSGANLKKARFIGGDLSGSDLSDSSLRFADVRLARLSNVNTVGADLYGVQFEPLASPPAGRLAYARNLHHLTWSSDPSQLAELKTRFRELGFRMADRQVIAAMRRKDAALWETVVFGYTSDFGASPGRALYLGGMLWVICAAAYLGFMHSSRPSGIYFVAKNDAGKRREWRVQSRSSTTPESSCRSRVISFSKREWRLLRAAMLFSTMSAFNIGFRDINFGRWIRLLMIRDYDLKAVRWARPIAGAQAVLSVALLASFILTYWGRPFEN